MEKTPNIIPRKKTKDELHSQVNRFGEDLYPPSANKDEILNLSEDELKNKYTRRYEIYTKLLRSANSDSPDLSPTELVKMKKWLTALNTLDTYISNHNKEIQDSGLWDRQFSVFEDIREFLEKGGNSGYVKLPTRSGKTVIFTKLVEALSMKTVIVVPNQSLVTQTESKIAEFSSGLDVGKVYGKAKEFGRDVTITTYQSLVSMVSKGQIKPEEVECLILDEVHRGLSEMRSDVINQFKEDTLKLGFSATTSFSETKGADKILQTEIHSLTLAEASMEGLISPFSVVIAETDVDISNIKVLSTGDYNTAELSKAVNLESRNRSAIELYQKMFPDQKAIAYCVDIKHAEDFNNECVKNGINSRVVSSNHRETNEQNIDDFQQGKISMLVNVDILTEGFDNPETSVCLNLRPTFSRVVAEQRGGRVLTLDPNNPDKHAYIVEFLDRSQKGKRPLTFYDVVGMTESYFATETRNSNTNPVRESHVNLVSPKIDGLKVHTDAKEVMKILNKTKVSPKKMLSSEPLHNDFMDDKFISLNNMSPDEVKSVAKSLEIDFSSEPLYKTDPDQYKDMGERLQEVLIYTLTPREQKIIKMRFFEDMTLEEVGQYLGVGRERVRQIEAKALRRLRHPSSSRILGTFWPTKKKKKKEEQ